MDRALIGFRAGTDAVYKRKVSRPLAEIKLWSRSFERTAYILDTTLPELSNWTNRYDYEV
jgi:hypothetical protein